MFSRKYLLAFILALGILGSVAIRRLGADGPTVVINELMWMGSSVSSLDEWIELRNLTDQPVDLSNWKLTKKSSGNEVSMLTIPAGKTINPNGYFLISNYAETSVSSVLNITPDLINSDVTLANSALQVRLYDASGTLLDTADDGSGNPLSGKYDSANQVYFSMERNRTPGDGSLLQNWHPARTSVNIKAGLPELATPKLENSNALPVAEAGPDLNSNTGQLVNFDGSDSYDPEADTLTFQWDFGDGSNATGSTPSHAFVAAGEYAVSLTVSDPYDSALDALMVTVTAPPVVAPTNTSVNPNANQNVNAGIIPSSTSCRGLRLNELFPNPVGSDDTEFIELENPTASVLSLSGCKLVVNDTRMYAFSQGSISARGWLVADKALTKLSLTNDGAMVILKDSDGAELDRTEYAKAKDGLSWSRFGNEWQWTETPTPGKVNQVPVDGTEDDSGQGAIATNKNSSTKAGLVILDFALGEIQELDSGDQVRVQAVVTAPVDALGVRVTYLQDETGAVSLLLAEETPKPKVGDVVKITATVRSYQGRKRLSVKKDDLNVIARGQPSLPREVTFDELTVDMADHLVVVNGVVESSSGSKITLEDGTAQGDVSIKASTGIIKPKMSSGDRLTATGIVNVTTSGIKILPRSIEDLRVERVLGISTSSQTKPEALATNNQHQTWWYWALVGVGILAASAKPVWEWWKRRRAEKLA